MKQIPCQDYLDKIIILENSSHRMRKYSLINPIDFDGSLDIIEIQKITKLLSSHIGYDKLIFTISFKDLDKTEGKVQDIFSNTAGNVLLDDKEDVLIHLSKSLNKYPDSILATLSHEISHKYIHLNRLTFKNTYENEVFTDLTSVYLGYGKLMLNGVEVVEKIKIGNTEKTYTKSVGYLNRDQLAFIYLVVNYVQGECSSSYYSNLKDDAIESVKRIEKEYHTFLKNIKFYRIKTLEINDLRYKLAYLEKLINLTKPKNTVEIKEYIKDEFTQLNLADNRLRNFKKEFLNRVLDDPKKSKLIRKDIPEISINDGNYNQHTKINRELFTRNIRGSLKLKEIDITECLVCKKNLRIKTNNIGIIICPDCNFKFAVNTLPYIDKNRFLSHIMNLINKLMSHFAD
jgi:ribosomal protein L37AE/L43A